MREMTIRLGSIAVVIVLGMASPVIAQSTLPPCPKDQNKRFHNCFGTYVNKKTGSVYTGDFQNNNKGGQGVLRMADGSVYSGQWKNGVLDGHGTARLNDGYEYVGTWKDGEMDQGTLTWANGEKYVGTFKDGRRNGVGTIYRADGSVKRSGTWDMGFLVPPKDFPPPVRSASAGRAHDATPLLKVFQGHTRPIFDIALPIGGRTALSAGGEGMKLWDIASGTILKTFEGNKGGTGAIAVSPDGTQAASVGDTIAKVWNVASGRLIQSFKGHSGDVHTVAFAPDGQHVFTGGDDKVVRLWETGSGRLVKTFVGNPERIIGLAVSPDGRIVAAGGGDDKTIRVWDTTSGRLLRTLSGHSGRILKLAFSPDGQKLLVGCSDGTVSRWDVDSGRLVWTVKAHDESVRALAIAPDGRTVLSGGYDSQLKQWDLASGQLLRTFNGHAGSVYAAAYLPDGRSAISAGEDKTLMLWDLEAGTPAPAPAAVASAAAPAGASLPAVPAAATPALQAMAAVPRPAVSSERRVALVIGNSDYRAVPRLGNPGRDAKMVADTLRTIGFSKVIEVNDLNREQLTAAIHAFAAEADRADWAMVYFAGHGMEIGGVNYLIPVDAKLLSDRDVQFEALPLSAVLSALEGARKLRLIVLDACRNNPFANQMKMASAGRSVGRGLGRIEPDAGTLVVYAAKDGQIAQDGDGANSPFASALAKRLTTPGMEIRRLFDYVADDVMDLTRRVQQPYTYGRLAGREDYFFVAPQ